MKMTKETNGNALTIQMEGRLDTITAPELEKELKQSLDGVQLLTLDMAGLEYISSAGLRVLLSAQKTMNRQGRMVVRHAGPNVMEVFEVTGFSDLLNLE